MPRKPRFPLLKESAHALVVVFAAKTSLQRFEALLSVLLRCARGAFVDEPFVEPVCER